MAGSYLDVPDHRMAYDRDGTALILAVDAAAPVEQDAATRAELNSESVGSSFLDAIGVERHFWVGLIFPELRDVTAYFFNFSTINVGQSVGAFESSVDTTTLVDGTWTTREADFTPYVGPTTPGYRSGIHTLAPPLAGVKAIRWRLDRVMGGADFDVHKLHVYGKPSAGANPHRLRLWHPTLDQEETGAYFDWGNVPRGAQLFRSFRVKNNSPTLTANGVTVALEALTDPAPSLITQHRLSLDGVAWAASVNLGALAPGAISVEVRVRNTADPAAAFGLGALRRIVDAASFS